MRDILSTAFQILLLSIIPSFLIIVSTTSEFDDWFGIVIITGLSLHHKKILCLIIGLAVTGGVLPIQNLLLKKRKNSLEKFFETDVLPNQKTSYDLLLKEKLSADFSESSVRLFLPLKNFRYFLPDFLPDWCGKKITLKYIPLNDFVFDQIKPIKFVVYPEAKSQGLVGKSFCDRGISIRDGDNNSASYKDFYDRMSTYQKVIASDHNFVMTIPIINESSEIVGIVSVDCKKILGIQPPNASNYHVFLAFARDFYNVYLNIYKENS